MLFFTEIQNPKKGFQFELESGSQLAPKLLVNLYRTGGMWPKKEIDSSL